MPKRTKIKATRLSLPHVLVLLGDDLFLHYINFVYPYYDLYEYVTLDGLARVHRYFLELNPKKENKPEDFDILVTPMYTLEKIRELIRDN